MIVTSLRNAICACVSLSVFAAEVSAADWLVNTLVDENDSSAVGGVSLREAIAEAASGDTIRFDSSLDDGTISLGGTELSIDKSLSIDASALPAGLRISASGTSRVISVASGATVTLDTLEIAGGVAGTGAGLLVESGATVTVLNSAVFANFAAPGEGGGIVNRGTLLVVNSTIAGNGATANLGGGISNVGRVTLRHVTIADNTAVVGGGIYHRTGTDVALILENCIVARNTGNQADIRREAATTTVTSNGANLIGDNTSVETLFPVGVLAGNAANPLDAGLASFNEYGGPSSSIALLAGSPAIDAAIALAEPRDSDQRGFNGTVGGASDLGAYELGPTLTVTTAADSGAGSLRAAVEGAAATDDATILFDTSLAGSTIQLTSGEIAASNRRTVIDGSALTRGVTISGGFRSRVFNVSASAELRLNDLMIIDGDSSASASPGQIPGGGGIRNQGVLHMERCTVARCATGASGLGGGVYNEFGATLTMRSCTLNANTADLGGGIYVNGGRAELTHVTISGNYASSDGGGLRVSSDDVRISNSIIAGNSALSSGPDVGALSQTTVTLNGVNLLSDLDGSNIIQDGGILVKDPLLAPLGDYGGRTPTMALLAGSPAINAGLPSILDVDQRGYPRVDQTDIGALEAGPAVNVTNSNDSGAGSLRGAVAAATSPGARIVFLLAPTDNRIILSSGELVVPGGRSLLFDASNQPVTVDANGTSRVLRVDGGSVVVSHSLTIAGGSAGAGINGGGILNSGRLTLIDSTVSGNESDRGGGISSFFGDLTLLGSTIANNTSTELGGGLELGKFTTITSSTIANNQSAVGGGIYSFNGTVLFLDQVTVSANTAANGGGGIINQDAEIHLESSIIAANTSPVGSPDLQSSGGTLTRSGANIIGSNASVATAFPSGTPNGNGDFVGSSAAPFDPALGSLADNGGPTATMALLSGSPAIDAALVTIATPLSDQRGFPRLLGPGLDIGAFEAAVGNYSSNGVTLYGSASGSPNAEPLRFQISSSRDFLQSVSTLAGTGVPGNANGSNDAADFSYPSDVAEDSMGFLFVADPGNQMIRMISPQGEVTTIAGTGNFGFVDGNGTAAEFRFPSNIAVGPDDNLYVSDTLNHSIRKLTRPNVAGFPWVVTTVAGSGRAGFRDGIGASAQFSRPHGLTLDASGNIYVADTSNHRIRKVTPNGTVSTFAGNGTSGLTEGSRLNAQFASPYDLAFDSAGELFVADRENHRIRRIGIDNQVATVAGLSSGFSDTVTVPGRPTAGGLFNNPTGIVFDGGENLIIADLGNHAIRKVAQSQGFPWRVSTIAGTGSPGFADGSAAADGAQFNCPTGLVVASNGSVIIADEQNHRIRRLADPLTLAASPGTADRFGQAFSLVIDAASLGLDRETVYYFRSVSSNDSVLATGESFALLPAPTVKTMPASLITRTEATLNAIVDPNGVSTQLSFEYSPEPDLAGPLRVSTLVEGLSGQSGVAVDTAGNVYVADRLAHKILRVVPAGTVSVFAGSGTAGFADGIGAAAQFDRPTGVAIDGSNNLYVSDERNHRIRKITPGGAVTTIAGSGVAGFQDAANALNGKLLFPSGLAATADGTTIYVADRGNHRIRVIAGGGLSTLAGSGVPGFAGGGAADAQFMNPTGVAADTLGNVYVADRGNHRIRKITTEGLVITVAGSGEGGFLDGVGSDAQFASPSDVAFYNGIVYVADRGNHRLRRIDANDEVSTFAGSGVAGVEDSISGQLAPATASQFNSPARLAVDAAGTVFVAEEGSGSLRKVARSAQLVITLPQTYDGASGINLNAKVPEILSAGVTYYFRARATSAQSEITGQILSFTTPSNPVIALFDGTSVAAPPVTSGQTTPVSFGSTPLGQPKGREITLTNQGEWELTITGVNLPDGFEAGGVSSVLAQGDSLTFTVTLSAIQGGDFSGDLEIASDDPEQSLFSFPIDGVVLNPPVVTTLAATANGANSVTLNASVNPNDSATSVRFEYSLDPLLKGVLVSTAAGASSGYAEGTGTEALFNTPWGLAIDGDGIIYVADTFNHRIRKVMPDGSSSTLAGTGVAGFADGPGVAAQFDQPVGLVLGAGGSLFVSDSQNHRIRKISPVGEVTTFSGLGEAGFTDGDGTAARFSFPWGLAIDATGNLFVADRQNHRIRRVAPDGMVSTLAGTGIPGLVNGARSQAQFDSPGSVAVNTLGVVFVTEFESHTIRRIEADGSVSTLAGAASPGFVDATGSAARFDSPRGIGIDAAGQLVVADQGNHRLRAVAPDGMVTTLAGSGTPGTIDGLGTVARFDGPITVTTAPSAELLVAESGSSAIRRIASATSIVEVSTNLNGDTVLPVSLVISDVGSTCYFRASATNIAGTSVGAILSCRVEATPAFDTWAFNTFGADATNPQIAGLSANPDGDLHDNLQEFAFNLDPNAYSADPITIAYDGGAATLTYPRRTGATGLEYRVEWSTDRVVWKVEGVTETVPAGQAGGPTENVVATVAQSIVDTALANNLRIFIRVTITQL